jgi:hypothetical protein
MHWLRIVLSLCLWPSSISISNNKYNLRFASRSASIHDAHDRKREKSRVHALHVKASVNELSATPEHQVGRQVQPRRSILKDSEDDTVWEHKYIGATLRNWLIALGCFLITLLTCFNIFTVFSHIWSLCRKDQRSKEEDFGGKKRDTADAVVSRDECSSTSPSSPDVEDPIPVSPLHG